MNITPKILIITDQKIHIGLASSNRILSYSEAFGAVGCNVDILIFRTGYGDVERDVQIMGAHGYANYYYSSNTVGRSSIFLIRKWRDLVGIFNALRYIFSDRVGRDGAAIFYTVNPFCELVFAAACRIRGIKRAKELSEHPSVYFSRNSWFQQGVYQYYSKIGLRLYSHFIVMTSNLTQALVPMIRRSARTLLVPMTVDLARFGRSATSGGMSSQVAYIAYAGQLNENKDGVATLIRAFSLIASKHDCLSLYLAGKFGDSESEAVIRAAISDSGVADRIKLTGSLSREQIPRFLLDARLLVLARPDSLQAQMGFPTKLGEYLATGNPVVVTRVGEIPQYLEDGISAIFAEPGSVEDLASGIDKALGNWEWAAHIGQRGKQVAMHQFDNLAQAHRILSFLDLPVRPSGVLEGEGRQLK